MVLYYPVVGVSCQLSTTRIQGISVKKKSKSNTHTEWRKNSGQNFTKYMANGFHEFSIKIDIRCMDNAKSSSIHIADSKNLFSMKNVSLYSRYGVNYF